MKRTIRAKWEKTYYGWSGWTLNSPHIWAVSPEEFCLALKKVEIERKHFLYGAALFFFGVYLSVLWGNS